MRRIRTVSAAFLATMILAPVGVAPVAHAAVDQVCALNEVIVWDPPLTNTPQAVTFTVNGQLFNCTNSSALTGSYTESGAFAGATCALLLGGGFGTRVFDWTNPAVPSSTFSYTLSVTRIGGNFAVAAVGSITSGSFTGAPTKSLGLAPQPDPLACTTTGVRRQTAVGTVTIGI